MTSEISYSSSAVESAQLNIDWLDPALTVSSDRSSVLSVPSISSEESEFGLCPVHNGLHFTVDCPIWQEEEDFVLATALRDEQSDKGEDASTNWEDDLDLFDRRQGAEIYADSASGYSSTPSRGGWVSIREEADCDLERKLRSAVEVDGLPFQNLKLSAGRTGVPRSNSDGPSFDGSWSRAVLDGLSFSGVAHRRKRTGERLRRRGVLANAAQRMMRNAFEEMPGNPVVGGETSHRLLSAYFKTLFAGEVEVRGWHRVAMLEDGKTEICLDVEHVGTGQTLRVSLGLFVRLFNYMAFRPRTKATLLMLRTKCNGYAKSLSMGPEVLAQVMHGSCVLATYVPEAERHSMRFLRGQAGERLVSWSSRLNSGLLDEGNEWLSGKKLLRWGLGGATSCGLVIAAWLCTWGHAPLAWTGWALSVHWAMVVALATPLLLAAATISWLSYNRKQPISLAAV